MADDQNTGVASQDFEAAEQVKRLLRAAQSHRYRMFLMASLFAIIGVAAALLVPDLYESRTLLLLRESKLVDDSILLEAIQDKSLAQKERTLSQELVSFSWVNDVLRQVEWVEWAEARGDSTKLQELVKKVRDPSKFEVQIDTDAAGELLVELIFRWYDPQQAHDYVLQTRRNWVDRRIQQTEKYWSIQLQRAEKVLERHLQAYNKQALALQQFQTDHDLSVLSETNADAQLRIELVVKRSETRAEVQALEVRIRGLQELKDATEEKTRHEDKQKNPVYEQAEASLKSGQKLLGNLLERYKETHPTVKKQRRRVEDLQVAFDELQGQEFSVDAVREEINPAYQELERELAMAVPDLDANREKMRDLDAQLAEVEKRMAVQPMLMNQLNALQNELAVARDELNRVRSEISPLKDKVGLLIARSNKLYMDSEEELKAAGAYDILEEPIVPRSPVGLPKAIFPVVGLVLGALLSLAISLLSEMTRSTYDDPKEVHRALQLPVLGGTGNISTARELRRTRIREITQMAGGVLIVLTLGALVYVASARVEMLPLGVQSTIEDLRSQFK